MGQDGFRDRNHRFSYLVACENARRLGEDPQVLKIGSDHLERFARHDPRHRDGYLLWADLLRLPSHEIAIRLIERSARGDYVRETAPSFGALPNGIRTRLLRLAASTLVDDPDRLPGR